MQKQNRRQTQDVCDYHHEKLCTVFDSAADISGQAQNVYTTYERNGWKSLTFELPSTYDTENGQEPNYRLDAIKADYLIHSIEYELADGIWVITDSDWYILTEPKQVHTGKAMNMQVNAGHVSQLLKTKNLVLEFTDDTGNNGGTIGELVDKCLEGTGWTLGTVASFKENDGETEKYRTLKANVRTGTFKLISSICELFDAKPVYHGETRTVDLLPLNPVAVSRIPSSPAKQSKAAGIASASGTRSTMATLSTASSPH